MRFHVNSEKDPKGVAENPARNRPPRNHGLVLDLFISGNPLFGWEGVLHFSLSRRILDDFGMTTSLASLAVQPPVCLFPQEQIVASVLAQSDTQAVTELGEEPQKKSNWIGLVTFFSGTRWTHSPETMSWHVLVWFWPSFIIEKKHIFGGNTFRESSTSNAVRDSS